MNSEQLIGNLARNGNVFRELLNGLPSEVCRWRMTDTSWCLLEILCHLYDEEIEDFRARTLAALTADASRALPIDPVGWVTQSRYIDRDFEESLDKFLEARTQSVEWLRGLKDPDWAQYYVNPKWGNVSAMNMLANWVAHDYHHIRQINAITYSYLKTGTGEDLTYAGNWRP